MVVYYHYVSDVRYNAHTDFPAINPTLQFNAISSDRTGTTLSALNIKHAEISSNLTNNVSFIQAGLGIVTKIDFPGIKNLLQTTTIGSVVNAQLVLQPVAETYNYPTPLPPKLNLYQTDYNDDLGPVITVPGLGSTAQTGNLFIDNVFNIDTRYTYDVTRYLINMMISSNNQPASLLLIPSTPQYNTTVERVILGNNNFLQNQLKLNIYFLQYE